MNDFLSLFNWSCSVGPALAMAPKTALYLSLSKGCVCPWFPEGGPLPRLGVESEQESLERGWGRKAGKSGKS